MDIETDRERAMARVARRLAFALTLVLAGCAGGGGGPTTTPPPNQAAQPQLQTTAQQNGAVAVVWS